MSDTSADPAVDASADPWRRSRAVVPRLDARDRAESTNDTLRVAVAVDSAGWPHGATVVTRWQTAGRGRLGRSWQAPPGKTIAASTLLHIAPPRAGWIPLLAGCAMAEAARSLVVAGSAVGVAGSPSVAVKWPNDVLVDGYKLSGILCERVAAGVIVGAGVNLTLVADDLAAGLSGATSLGQVMGHDPDPDDVLATYLAALLGWVARDAVDPAASEAAVADCCGTLGRVVRVELPGGSTLRGRADCLDAEGRLVVVPSSAPRAVAAGDVTHLRY